MGIVDSVFCESCGVAIAVDDRFCGECGAGQEVAATTEDDMKEAMPADLDESLQGTTGIAPAIASAEPVPRDDRATKKPSMGFWDAAGMAMELGVRGVYVVLCAGIAVLGFQNGEPVIGGGAVAYGLYILCGGKWFVS